MRTRLMTVAAGLGLLLLVPSVLASATQVSVSPSSVPTNGIVTISVCTTTQTVLQQILVTTPSGAVWRHQPNDIPLSPSFVCPTNLNVQYGDSSLHWCVVSLVPLAPGVNGGPCLSPQPSTTQTGDKGTYSVEEIWKTTVKPNSEQFHDFQQFQVVQPPPVPEFGIPGILLSSVSLVGLAILLRTKLRPTPK